MMAVDMDKTCSRYLYCACIGKCLLYCNIEGDKRSYICMFVGISIMERYIFITTIDVLQICACNMLTNLLLSYQTQKHRNFLFATNFLMEHMSPSLFLKRLFVRQEFMLLLVLDVYQSFGVIKSLYQLHPLSILLHIMWTLCVL